MNNLRRRSPRLERLESRRLLSLAHEPQVGTHAAHPFANLAAIEPRPAIEARPAPSAHAARLQFAANLAAEGLLPHRPQHPNWGSASSAGHGKGHAPAPARGGRASASVASIMPTPDSSSLPPTAYGEFSSVVHDHTLTVAAPGVLGNDSNPAGGAMTAGLVTSTSHGTLSFNSDGSFTYLPNAHYVGIDSFKYTASNANGASTPATTDSIQVTDQTPVISNHPSASILHDHAYTAAAPGLRFGTYDPDGDPFTIAITTQPTHGALTYNADGSWTYVPAAHYVGGDSFQYTASDGLQTSAPASAYVYSTNNPPAAADRSNTVYENQTLTVAMPGVRSGVSDADGDPTTLALVAGPTHGSLIADANGGVGLRQDGSFTYKPTTDFVGTDTFTFKANDGILYSRIATVTITVVAPQISIVEWVQHPESPLTTNSGPGNGLAIFPDADTINSTTVSTVDRSLVDFRATLSAAIPGIKVYFQVIDVDDPSANKTTPVGNPSDPLEVVDDESDSSDNRGDGARTGPGSSMFYIVQSDNSGRATVTNFRVSMQPGDNYRIVASVRQIGSSDFTAIQDNGTASGIQNNTLSQPAPLGTGPGVATMSTMLTVWRRLHVEDDTMGPVAGNTVTGTMTVIPGNPQSLVTVTPSQPLTDSADRFVGGTLVDSAGRIYNVVANTSPQGGSFDVRVITGTTAPAAGSFTLRDDDSLRDGQALPRSDRSTVTAAMAAAYMEPLFGDVGTFDTNVPFILNVDGSNAAVNAAIGSYWQSRSLNSDNFWVAYVLEAFQGPIGEDGDPNSELGPPPAGSIEGFTAGDHGGCLIFHEVNVEYANAFTRSASVEEQDTVVHELGHAVGDAPEDVTEVKLGRPSVYTLESLKGIRSSPKPSS